MKPTRISLEIFAGDLETYLDGIENNDLVLTKEGEPRFVLISAKRATAYYEAVLDLIAHAAMKDSDDGKEPEKGTGPDTDKSE